MGRDTERLRAVTVRELRRSDQDGWLELWGEYLRFYDAVLAAEVTERTWRGILENDRMIGVAAVRAGEVVGFGIVILHEATWFSTQVAYLEDLYVKAAERGKGVGRAIIDNVINRSRTQGCSVVYWHTRAGNIRARGLYDSYCHADDYVRYRMSLVGPHPE